MKKNNKVIFSLIFIILSSAISTCFAEEKSWRDRPWQWSTAEYGKGYDQGNSIVMDNEQNLYVTGNFQSTATFGSDTLSTTLYNNVFVTKMDSEGKFLWSVQAVEGSGCDNIFGVSLTMDNSNNCYIFGKFNGTVHFSSHSIISLGNSSLFVAKIDSNGNWLWVKSATCLVGNLEGRAIAMDNKGNIYFTGFFYGTVQFGSYSLENEMGDIFVSKMDANGNWLWALQSTGNEGFGSGEAITIDKTGNIYVTGWFADTATFGTQSFACNGERDIFVAKLDKQANWQWAVQAGGNGEEIFTDGSNGIIAGLNGNVYVVGTFEQEAFFGPYSVKSAGATDIFVAEINPDGTWVNVAHSGGRFYDSGEAITINKDGTIYITGTFKDLAEFGPYTLPGYNCENDIFVAKLDKNLHWIGVIQAGGWFNDHANGIISDSQGNTFITGCFSKKAMFGRKYLFHNSVLEGDGDMNIYVAKLNNLQPEQQSSRKTVLTNNIFYKEFFNTDSDHFWSMLDESGSEKITNGTLVLNNSDSKRQINSIQEFYLDYKGNYRIEAKIKHISGVDNYGFGLIWGAMGNYSYNSFLISNDGLFEVYKKEGDKIESIKDWTKNDIIRIDDDNILAIEHDGYRVKFYINDTYVWAMNASQFYKYYAAKSVGFAVLSVQKIEVDYLKISSDQEDFIYPSY